MDDNLNDLHRRALGLIWIMMIFMGCVSLAWQQCAENSDTQHTDTTRVKKTNPVVNINNQIDGLYNDIAYTQRNAMQLTNDSLMKIPEYAFVVQNRDRVDSMTRANQDLMARAYQIARRKSVHAIVYKNESVFSDFGQDPSIKQIKYQYYKNKRDINDFKINQECIKNTPEMVKCYFDRMANNHVAQQLKKIDSLLNIKDSIITHKTR